LDKNYYFISNIEGDFLICAGMSQLIKSVKHNAKTIMIMPEHPRVKNKMQNFYKCFDEVLILPFVNLNKNLFKGIKECNYFIKEFRKIHMPKESNIFMFDIYELNEMLIYSNLIKKQNKNKLKINCISAFESGESNKDNISLVWINSIFLSFYSLIYAKKIFREYKTKNTSSSGLHFFKANWDNMLCIQDALPNRSKFKQIYTNLPYPPFFIKIDNINEFAKSKNIISGDCFIILVASDIPKMTSIKPEHYWGQINNLIEYLSSRYEYPIYVKNHPGFPDDSEKWIKNKRVLFIDKEALTEELYLLHGKAIKGVFAYCSTGLLTASWLGIKSINIDEYLGIKGQILKRFKKFMNLSQNIKNITYLEALDGIFFYDKVDMNIKLEGYKKWENVINII
jgi:hypothetical protein